MGYSILLVDDSETSRRALARTFRMARLPIDAIYEAENGREALEVLRHQWVDILLTDINMPIMNGEELVRSMKSSVEWREVPVAVISTEGSTTRIHSLDELGIAGYLRKPSRPEEVRDLMYRVLGKWE